MPARTMRTPAASDASSSVAIGSTSLAGWSSGFAPGATIATGGSQSRPTKNTPTSSEPITNSGSAIAASDDDRDDVVEPAPAQHGREHAEARARAGS